MNTDRRTYIRKSAGAAGALTLFKLLPDSGMVNAMSDMKAGLPEPTGEVTADASFRLFFKNC